MNITILSIFVIIASVFSIATQSVGMQCMKDSNKADSSSYRYLTFSLVTNIIIVLISVGMVYFDYKYKSRT